MRTLPREPWRGSQICGWQISYGNGTDEFCGERKANGRYFCALHHESAVSSVPEMAQGNVLGDRFEPVRLWFEPMEGAIPVEPTREEIETWEGGQKGYA